MMRRALSFAAALACTGPAAAQDGADPARIDDFAVPASAQPLGVEQLEPDAAPLPPSAPVPVRDSSAPVGASSAADSAPRATAPITGTDRCDPQQPSADRAECRNTLERRAGDFAAPAPATLSAEQALIASQRPQASRHEPVGSGRRARMAGTGPTDDELRSNQELATIYLSREGQPVDHPKEPTIPEIPAALDQVIEALRQAENTGR
ncbi:hypothetical protein PK98_08970 [Croceibacterium mercuriale]|uniref:Uncharacterized protein n=1 Tax=Croceibacterium mercuriale TaxID=1572751 RepID=A0A0B2BYI3_9SPHN|nr:hypothetical protein [Croceibacterium mercuriale]KHL26519.1 hypothetical protein PK98_08970 [Croceibacterium mercuriale]